MKKRIISMVVMLFVITALLPAVAFAVQTDVNAVMAKDSATATLTAANATEDIAVYANDFSKFIFGDAGGYVQPGTKASGKFNIINNTGAEYEVVDCGLHFEVKNTSRVNNSAAQAISLSDAAVKAMSAADWWNLCNTYYTAKFGADWTTNFEAVRDALGHGSGGQGNTAGKETSPEMIALANWLYPQIIYLTFDQNGANAVSSVWSDSEFAAKPPCTLAEYMAGSNTAWVISCINGASPVIGNGTKTFDMAIAFDGPRIGNAAQGASYQLSVGLLLRRIDPQPSTTASITVKSELEGGAVYDDADVVSITLSQGGDIKYTYTLNKANGWQAVQEVEAGTYTVAETLTGYTHVSFSGTGYNDATKEITVTAGEAQTLLDINAKLKPVITVKTELEGGAAYADTDVVVITLSQSGVVKYTYVLDKTNGWQSSRTVEAGTYTVSETLYGYKHISFSGTGYNDATKEITVALGETRILLDINAKVKPNSDPPGKTVPKTGDDTSLILPIALAGGSLVILAILILLLIRRKNIAAKRDKKPEETKTDKKSAKENQEQTDTPENAKEDIGAEGMKKTDEKKK